MVVMPWKQAPRVVVDAIHLVESRSLAGVKRESAPSTPQMLLTLRETAVHLLTSSLCDYQEGEVSNAGLDTWTCSLMVKSESRSCTPSHN